MTSRRAVVLVVEDDDPFRDMTVRLLERRGHAVLSARGASEAAAVARQHGGRIDLLITDLVMEEGGDGLLLARELSGRHRALKVLFMSGYGKDAMTAAALQSERRAFIEKPFTPAALEDAVDRLLGMTSPGRHLSARRLESDMACCGANRRAAARTASPASGPAKIKIVYVGGSVARVVGAKTGRSYEFTSMTRMHLVAAEDAAALLAIPGFRRG